jgi:transposase InsO family protein
MDASHGRFVALRLHQVLLTAHTNATIESFFATFKGKRLYHGTYSNPIELISDSDAFIVYYNEDRLHNRVRDAGREARRTSR